MTVKKDILMSQHGDIQFKNGDFVLAEEADYVRQNWLIRVRTWQGEWFLNLEDGIPYIDRVLVKNPDLAMIGAMFSDMTYAMPNVIRVLSSTVKPLDKSNRRYLIEVEAIIDAEERTLFTYTLQPDAPVVYDIWQNTPTSADIINDSITSTEVVQTI